MTPSDLWHVLPGPILHTPANSLKALIHHPEAQISRCQARMGITPQLPSRHTLGFLGLPEIGNSLPSVCPCPVRVASRRMRVSGFWDFWAAALPGVEGGELEWMLWPPIRRRPFIFLCVGLDFALVTGLRMSPIPSPSKSLKVKINASRQDSKLKSFGPHKPTASTCDCCQPLKP